MRTGENYRTYVRHPDNEEIRLGKNDKLSTYKTKWKLQPIINYRDDNFSLTE